MHDLAPIQHINNEAVKKHRISSQAGLATFRKAPVKTEPAPIFDRLSSQYDPPDTKSTFPIKAFMRGTLTLIRWTNK